MSRKRRPAYRQSAPAERTDAQQAEDLEALARKYPQDQEELLTEAAEFYSRAGQHDRALALYQQVLDGDCEDPHLVRALRIDALWDAGRTDEAREAAKELRRRHPAGAGPWHIVAEMFETADEFHDAADYFTAAVTHLLGSATPLTVDAVRDASDATGIEMLVIGRHRVRRSLGQPHDDLDQLAHSLYEDRPPRLRTSSTLDDLHAPELRAAAGNDPQALIASIEKLSREVEARRSALSRPRLTCALFWSRDEFTQLLDTWPELADHYGTEHHEHTRHVEQMLQRLSNEGGPHLGIAHATVNDFTSFSREEYLSLKDGDTRARYAADLAARGQATPWPPPRNNPCWCGSTRKYKKCCGNPALT
ncbi:SEC-C domain-containing protein [Streptomyces sp. ET3-23]|uniref:SEC-C metal-binding domain-containing protein n=1 Tax=Streptomyces sp. ET3-23 TaxID=2885643 RepID=UPI001D12BB86|nr:SEC-C metal-binding domain-containing protein [Streptomyces sp. ET3-23]MCC2280713.1 SEC-C domain-containing protein [Streptomyces sp. ET3-23]